MTSAELSLFLVRLLAGTGVFLVGVHLLTANIEQLATGKIRELFGRTADKKRKLYNGMLKCDLFQYLEKKEARA